MTALYRLRVSEHFQREAQLWGEIYGSATVESAVYATRQEKMLALVRRAAPPGARVLEVGCGAGLAAAALARAGYRVCATDLVHQMARTARQKAEQEGVADRARVICADGEALPFATGTFDVVYGIAVLEWAGDRDRMLAEVARVIRPAGRAVLSAANRWSLNRLLDPRLGPWMEPLKERFGGLRSKTFTAAELRRAFARAGLTAIRCSTAGYGPFTFFKYKLLAGRRGAGLHRVLQKLADRGAPFPQWAGYTHIVCASKPAGENR